MSQYEVVLWLLFLIMLIFTSQASLSDFFIIGSLVFGGCCSNVIALEFLVGDAPKSGNLITLAQFTFVALEGLRHHLKFTSDSWIPTLKPRIVPLFNWSLLVAMFFIVSVLNNIALGFRISVPLHIIFRSGGLIVSMLLGWAVIVKQVIAVVMVTAGVFLSTFSAANSNSSSGGNNEKGQNSVNTSDYVIGIALLSIALILSCIMGLYQEMTYSKHGSDWREGLFYTHFLALPMFLIFYSDIKHQVYLFNSTERVSLSIAFDSISGGSILVPETIRTIIGDYKVPILWLFLILNVLTQYVCVSGVHRLNSRSTALTLNLVLNLRKFTSLMISVWYFDNEFTIGMMIGGILVFLGTFLYSISSSRSTKAKELVNTDEDVLLETTKKIN
ncbi:14551_t:CDS:2 [Ambispora leptoticha]|uniref:14551_t:CDS:1 n=1 Tax=Ambispora leptoticha TaxID=144679 RepID=A0A9N8YWS2_9GLOM|nr:14551_t:CDS:2 [Ambispora leptoticha]